MPAIKFNPCYSDWDEARLRYAIWMGNNGMYWYGGMYWRGPHGDVEEIRAELRRRGLSDRGYHEDANKDANEE